MSPSFTVDELAASNLYPVILLALLIVNEPLFTVIFCSSNTYTFSSKLFVSTVVFSFPFTIIWFTVYVNLFVCVASFTYTTVTVTSCAGIFPSTTVVSVLYPVISGLVTL